MGPMASPITSLTTVYSTVHSGADQRKYQSSASLSGLCAGNSAVNFPHKWPVTRKCFHLMTSSWCVSQKLDIIRQVTTTGCFMDNEAKAKGQTSPKTTDRCNVMDAIFFTTKPSSFVVIDVLIIPNGNGQALNITIPLLFELINSLSHIVPKDIGIDISRLLNAEVKIAEIRLSLTTICLVSTCLPLRIMDIMK